MAYQRLNDWMTRLDALVCARGLVAYAWGTHDCCTLGADVVQAVTGVDLMTGLRGTYADEAQAYATLEQMGGLVTVLTQALGRPVPAAMAQPGDLGISNGALVFFGGLCWHGQGDVGLVAVPEPTLAWRCCGV
jgi:hypothetical protein